MSYEGELMADRYAEGERPLAPVRIPIPAPYEIETIRESRYGWLAVEFKNGEMLKLGSQLDHMVEKTNMACTYWFKDRSLYKKQVRITLNRYGTIVGLEAV